MAIFLLFPRRLHAPSGLASAVLCLASGSHFGVSGLGVKRSAWTVRFGRQPLIGNWLGSFTHIQVT